LGIISLIFYYERKNWWKYMGKNKLNYTAAGVDIAAGDAAVEKIKELAKGTFNESVLCGIGQFGAFFKPELKGYKNPVFISSADGVGTKLKVAFATGKHDTVGEDLVNHCVNDILVHGARPLFFLDYIATGKLNPDIIAEMVKGLARGCKNAGMALIGGETAEMPDFYQPGEYDVAGFIVGIVDQDKIINGSNIEAGDCVIGLSSTGLHTNGYSLARKIVFEVAGLKHNDKIPELGQTAGEALLTVHKSYKNPVFGLLEKYPVKGMAHITGGGIPGNLVRILPDNCRAEIDKGSWPILPIFEFLQKAGDVSEDDMYPAFNMGIGLTIVVSEQLADRVVQDLNGRGEKAYRIGRITSGDRKVVLKG
jgi:phosphoribosylformylglycinamidine cyclo-ligase